LKTGRIKTARFLSGHCFILWSNTNVFESQRESSHVQRSHSRVDTLIIRITMSSHWLG